MSLMGLFKKNENEAAYVGGKKHWVDVIKNTGPEDCLIWRQPEEDFNTKSTLIVMPGEEAVFVNGGTIEEVFDKGTYKLSTKNFPFISRLSNAFSGGISTFNCVVYFVSKRISRELSWGTKPKIQVRDRIFKTQVYIGACGAYTVRVFNPTVLIEKVFRNNSGALKESELNNYFGNQIKSIIVSLISAFLNGWPIELIGIQAEQMKIGEIIHPYLDAALKKYGLTCEFFSISALEIDGCKYDSLDEAQIQRVKMDTLGKRWASLTAADILKILAQNPGAGGVAAAGAGLGMGFAAGSAFSSMAEQMFAPFYEFIRSEEPPYVDDDDFVQEDADSAQASDEDPFEVLSKLKRMLDANLIEQAEFDAKKTEILSRM